MALFPVFINYKKKFQYIDINLISQSYSLFICDSLLLEAQKGPILFLLKEWGFSDLLSVSGLVTLCLVGWMMLWVSKTSPKRPECFPLCPLETLALGAVKIPSFSEGPQPCV